MVEVGLALGGFVLGLGVWFPFKHIGKRLLIKKREATAILVELEMKEREHMQAQNPSLTYGGQYSPAGTVTRSATWTNPNQYTINPFTTTNTSGVNLFRQSGSVSTQSGTS